jgi:biotin operon repressor
MKTKLSQNDLVLQLLHQNRGQWVSLPDLAEHMKGYAVHSRVANLRKMGSRIENRIEQRDGVKKSFYRLT